MWLSPSVAECFRVGERINVEFDEIGYFIQLGAPTVIYELEPPSEAVN